MDFQHSQTSMEKGKLLLSQKDFEKALTEFKAARNEDPLYGLAWMYEGVASVQLKRHSEAFECFAKAIEASPFCVDSYIQRALLNIQLEDYSNASRDLDRALAVGNSTVEKRAMIYYNRGLSKYHLNQFSEAVADYNQALQLVQDPEIYYAKGLCFSALGQPERAILEFSEAIEMEPNFAAAYRARAMAYIECGDLADAKKDLAHAPNANDWLSAGVTLSGMNKNNEASEFYDKVMELDPNNAKVKEAMKKKDDNNKKPALMGTQRRKNFANQNPSFVWKERVPIRWQWKKISFSELPQNTKVPYDLHRVGLYVEHHLLKGRGLFRLTPSVKLLSHSEEKMKLGEGETINLDIDQLAPSLILRYINFYEISFPLSMLSNWKIDASDNDKFILAKKMIGTLKAHQSPIVQYVLSLFFKVHQNHKQNDMPASNLAVILMPKWAPFPESNPSTMKTHLNAMEYLILKNDALFPRPVSTVIASADEEWADFEPSLSSQMENAFTEKKDEITYKIGTTNYKLKFDMMSQINVADPKRQRQVRRRLLNHNQSTLESLEILDISDELHQNMINVFDLLPGTKKCPSLATRATPVDGIIMSWPPVGDFLSKNFGESFVNQAYQCMKERFVCGPPANFVFAVPTQHPKCKQIIFVAFHSTVYPANPTSTINRSSAYEAMKSVMLFIRQFNTQQTNSENLIRSVILEPFADLNKVSIKAIALGYSEFFTSSAIVRQQLCGLRSLV